MRKDELNPYSPDENHIPLDRDSIRDLVLSELKNFRSSVQSFWGGLGKSVTGNLYGFFVKQGYGSYYQSPHALKTSQKSVSGNDFGRVFVEAVNDVSEGTPSWSFDLPTYSQKMLIKSTGPGLVYNSKTVNFTEGATLTGTTSKAKALITAVFPDGTNGTLYLTNIVGNFNDTEALTDSSGGAATATRLTYTRTNAIQRLYGVGGEDADTPGLIYTFWGAINNYAPMGLFTLPSALVGTARDPEQITGFRQEGFMYVRKGTPSALRIYLNGAWGTVGGSGGSAMKVIHATRSLGAAPGSVTYAHGLGTAPTKVQIAATQGVTPTNFSNGAWDGTSNKSVFGGVDFGASTASSVWISQGSSNFIFGYVASVDATNITIAWDKVGTPTGTADLIIQSWA